MLSRVKYLLVCCHVLQVSNLVGSWSNKLFLVRRQPYLANIINKRGNINTYELKMLQVSIILNHSFSIHDLIPHNFITWSCIFYSTSTLSQRSEPNEKYSKTSQNQDVSRIYQPRHMSPSCFFHYIYLSLWTKLIVEFLCMDLSK